jgi:hypothetical protein
MFLIVYVSSSKLTGTNNQNIEVKIVRIWPIVARSVAVLAEICLQNALGLWFLTDGSHFTVCVRLFPLEDLENVNDGFLAIQPTRPG